MQHVIGMLGQKGAGKDTAANALVEKGWVRIALAAALYREVGAAFDVTEEFLANRDTKETPLPELALYKCRDQVFVAVALTTAGYQLGVTNARVIRTFLMKPRSPRQIMQWWGTEYKRRLIRWDYWLEKTREEIRAQPSKNFVVTDIRFPEEALMVTEDFHGFLVRVTRPSQENETSEAAKHISEIAMQAYPVHRDLLNMEGDDGVSRLRQDILTWARTAVASMIRDISVNESSAA